MPSQGLSWGVIFELIDNSPVMEISGIFAGEFFDEGINGVIAGVIAIKRNDGRLLG